MNNQHPITSNFIFYLEKIVGKSNVITHPDLLNLYSCDGLRLQSSQPGCVVIPNTTEQVVHIIKISQQEKVPFVARGSGTGLSGGATSKGGLIIQLSQMNQILEIDIPNRLAVIQPGVINAHLSQETRPFGFHFAPDPSSQSASTIGGNFAENAGGPHTLKYGVTTNHVLGATIVMADGNVRQFGSRYRYNQGLDLLGLICGSEGTLGIATEIIVNLVPNPKITRTFLLTFDEVSNATNCVSAIIEGGVIPAALEMIDQLCIRAVEAKLDAGFPVNAGAVLLVEIDGDLESVEVECEILQQVVKHFTAHPIEEAVDETHRQRLWRGRKLAIGSMGVLAPAFYTNDGVVPRHQLTRILQNIYQIGTDHTLQVANLCHAGDGNIHPIILYDPHKKGDKDRAFSCSTEILRSCLELGGSLTGEHGIGTEKVNLMDKMFTTIQLDLMKKVRNSFDPENRCNPHKILPIHAGCGEVRAYAD